MTSATARNWMVWLAGATAVGASGCSSAMNEFVSRHLANDQQAQAKQRWESVQGGLKVQLARQHLAGGRIEEARRALAEAVLLTPNNPELYVLQCKANIEQGRFAEAQAAIDRAATLTEADPEVPYLQGLISERQGDLASAAQRYAEASIKSPQMAAFQAAQARVLVGLDRPVEALDLITRAVADFDDDVSLRTLAAQICRDMGIRGPAAEFAREAVRLQPDDMELQAELGDLLVWASRPREAVVVLEPLLPSDGDSTESDGRRRAVDRASVRINLARAYLQLSTWQKAQEVLEPLLGADSMSSVVAVLYARAALHHDDVDTAWQVIERLGPPDAQASEVQLLRAYLAYRKGQFDLSRRTAERAIDKNPDDLGLHMILARSAAALGDEETLRAALERISQRESGAFGPGSGEDQAPSDDGGIR